LGASAALDQVANYIGKEVADRLAALLRHAFGHDQAMALLWIALKTKQADGLTCSEAQGFAQIMHRFRLLEMVPKNALERVMVSRARSLASLFRRAESAQMAIADPSFRQMLGEGSLGEPLLARDGRRAYVEHKRNAGHAERGDEA